MNDNSGLSKEAQADVDHTKLDEELRRFLKGQSEPPEGFWRDKETQRLIFTLLFTLVLVPIAAFFFTLGSQQTSEARADADEVTKLLPSLSKIDSEGVLAYYTKRVGF